MIMPTPPIWRIPWCQDQFQTQSRTTAESRGAGSEHHQNESRDGAQDSRPRKYPSDEQGGVLRPGRSPPPSVRMGAGRNGFHLGGRQSNPGLCGIVQQVGS